MKKCFKCEVEKDLSEFYTNKSAKGGYHNQCKTCLKEGVKTWSSDNKDKRRKYVRDFKARNPEKIKQESQEYYAKNREDILARNKEWSDNNPDKVLKLRQNWTKRNPHYYTITGRIRKNHIDKHCTPPWVDESHMEKIKDIYKSARASSEFHEISFHVDHIEPLKGVNEKGEHVSCGLHVWWNLRSIPAVENLKKSNKLNTD